MIATSDFAQRLASQMAIMIPAWVDGELVPVEKLEAHRKGIPHKAVSVFLLNKDRMLIQRRALGKYHTPGLWANTCCTHPEWDESALDCAIRRLDEELGIRGVDVEHRQNLEYRADVGGGLTEHEIVDVFVGHVTDDIPVRSNPDEVMDTRWVTFTDLAREVAKTPEKFTPWLRIYLESHAADIFGEDMPQPVVDH